MEVISKSSPTPIPSYIDPAIRDRVMAVSYSTYVTLEPSKNESEIHSQDTQAKPEAPVNNTPVEAVNHPSHYNREGAMECLDEIGCIEI